MAMLHVRRYEIMCMYDTTCGNQSYLEGTDNNSGLHGSIQSMIWREVRTCKGSECLVYIDKQIKQLIGLQIAKHLILSGWHKL